MGTAETAKALSISCSYSSGRVVFTNESDITALVWLSSKVGDIVICNDYISKFFSLSPPGKENRQCFPSQQIQCKQDSKMITLWKAILLCHSVFPNRRYSLRQSL